MLSVRSLKPKLSAQLNTLDRFPKVFSLISNINARSPEKLVNLTFSRTSHNSGFLTLLELNRRHTDLLLAKVQ